MADLFECPRCKAPFVASDKALIARRNGYCGDCTKGAFLENIGISPEFLDGFGSSFTE